MVQFLQTPEAQLVVWTAAFAALMAIGFFLIAHARRSIRNSSTVPTSGEMMSKFGDLHSQGKLSDQEYKTIKSLLSRRLQKEVDCAGDSTDASSAVPSPKAWLQKKDCDCAGDSTTEQN